MILELMNLLSTGVKNKVQQILNIEISPANCYYMLMTDYLPHPSVEDFALPAVLTALGDETRLAIIAILARNGERAMTCGQFLQFGSKTAISYHVAKLREAGIIHVRPEGTKRLLTLRRSDLETRFPGFLDTVIASTAATLLSDAYKSRDVPEAAQLAGE